MAPSLIVMMEKQWLSVFMDAYTCTVSALRASVEYFGTVSRPIHPWDE